MPREPLHWPKGGISGTTPFVSTLRALGTGSQAVEQPVASSFDEILAAQRMLNANGFAVGKIDGQMSPRTQAAVLSFQRQNNLETDGRVTPSLITFLALHAVDRITEGDRADIIADSADAEATGFDFAQRSNVALVQRLLTRSGFDPGRIDGVAVAATEQAIRDFQSRTDLDVTGEITAELLSMLDEFEQSLGGG